MLDSPERVGTRFSIVLFLDFLLIPVAGFGFAVLFNVISINELQLLLLNGTLPLFSVLLIALARHTLLQFCLVLLAFLSELQMCMALCVGSITN